jgi:competence protein CoiA
MRYALDENNEKIEPKYSGQRALCPGCKTEVTGKIYSERKNHWAHLNTDCDNWYEPISDWHLFWQNKFPKENQEITLFDENNKEFHRADIMLNNGVVIEVQNSPIVIKEVSQRENFYNKNGLIWILNAQNLIPKSSFVNFFKPNNCQIKISFFTEYYSEFDTEDIINDLVQREYNSLKFINKNISNELIEYEFNSNTIGDPNFDKGLFECSINSLNWKYSRNNHNQKSSFKVDIKVIEGKYTFVKFLAKRQWRKFIDKMESPVFLDNVTDLHSDYLFWVQKDKIIEKEKFIEKYLSYTKHSS